MPIELHFILDLIEEGASIETELRGVTDEGSDNVMTIRIMEDDKIYRGLVVAATNEDREAAMLRWGGCKVIVRLTNTKGTIIMSVVSKEDNSATPDPLPVIPDPIVEEVIQSRDIDTTSHEDGEHVEAVDSDDDTEESK